MREGGFAMTEERGSDGTKETDSSSVGHQPEGQTIPDPSVQRNGGNSDCGQEREGYVQEVLGNGEGELRQMAKEGVTE
jgi:hypothetical protein